MQEFSFGVASLRASLDLGVKRPYPGSNQYIMKKLFAVVLFLSILTAVTESVYASGKVSLENGKVRVTVDLDTGL